MGNNAKLLLATLVGTLVLVVGLSLFLSNSGSNTAAAPIDVAMLEAGATHVQGPESSPVTIVEFADYQCPYCAQLNPDLKSILAQYPEAKFVFRHFPLMSIHANAVPSAQAAEAAHEQGKFWEMTDLLYSTQDEWKDLRDPQEFFVGLARQLHLDETAFATAYNDVAVRDRVYSDLRLGEQINVRSTPSFFYNGQLVSGLEELAVRLSMENFGSNDPSATESAQPATSAGTLVE